MKKYIFCKLCLGLWFFCAVFSSPVSAQELGVEVEWKVTDTNARSCIRAITSGELFRPTSTAHYYRFNGLIYRLRWQGSTGQFFCEEVELVQVSGQGQVVAEKSKEYEIDAESFFCSVNKVETLPLTNPFMAMLAKEICKPTVNKISMIDLKQGLTGAGRVRVDGFAYLGAGAASYETFFKFMPKFAMPDLTKGFLDDPQGTMQSLDWNTFLFCSVRDSDEKAAELLQYFKGAEIGEEFTVTGRFLKLDQTTLELEECKLETPVSR
jgi:hypothetical protein